MSSGIGEERLKIDRKIMKTRIKGYLRHDEAFIPLKFLTYIFIIYYIIQFETKICKSSNYWQ